MSDNQTEYDRILSVLNAAAQRANESEWGPWVKPDSSGVR